MKRISAILLAAGLVSSACAATPVISDVVLTQDPATRLVTVTYTLSGADAIVTPDILTNGVSIGEANIRTVAGDVFRKVKAGKSRRFTWRPDYDWDGQLFAAKAKLTAWPENDPPDWLVASLCVASNVQYYVCKEQLPWAVTSMVYKTRHLLMRRIRACGVPFTMGSISVETGRDSGREALHTAILTNDFYIGVYECTQQQYQFVTGSRPASSGYGGTDAEMRWYTYPASFVGTDALRGAVSDGIDWPSTGHKVKANSFFDKLRKQTGIEFDLPVEAQWEFAARAGCPFGLYNGYNLNNQKQDPHLDEIAWWTSNCVRTATGALTTQPVGLKKPNAFGLYDMLGNTCETCLDYYIANPTSCDPNIGPTTPSSRQRRGGCAVNWEGNTVRVNYRDAVGETGRYEAGFRIAWTLQK